MAQVFISYSHEDHHFAELLKLKLEEKQHSVWLDNGALRAGEDWRNGIEKGIHESDLVLAVMSPCSVASAYVTFEWAFAIGRDKAVVPLMVKECKLHPRMEPVHYLDFSVRGNLPWAPLMDRIYDIESDCETSEEQGDTTLRSMGDMQDPLVKKVLEYLNGKGIQLVSYERLRSRGICALSDDDLDKLVFDHAGIFRKARISGGKKGLAKR